MADESRMNEATPGVVETTDRGLFGFMKKKEDEAKPSEHDNVASGVENVHLSEQPHHYMEEDKKEEKHESLLEKLKHDDNSSSSSDEEGDDEEKKRRKKERKEKKKAGLKEKFGHNKEEHHDDHGKFGHNKEEHHHDHHGDTNVPIEKIHVQDNVYSEPSYGVAPPQHIVNDHVHQEHDKKEGGFMDKIKDKLPGQHKDGSEAAGATPVVAAHHADTGVEGDKEKKGFLDKIKEKIPGLHSKTDEEKKDADEEKKETHY